MFLCVCEIVVTTERQGGRDAGVSCHVGVCVTSEREKSGKRTASNHSVCSSTQRGVSHHGTSGR